MQKSPIKETIFCNIQGKTPIELTVEKLHKCVSFKEVETQTEKMRSDDQITKTRLEQNYRSIICEMKKKESLLTKVTIELISEKSYQRIKEKESQMERMSKDDQIAKARLEKKVKGASEAVIAAERMQQVIAELQVCEVWASCHGIYF